MTSCLLSCNPGQSSSENGSLIKGKYLLLQGANSFLLLKTHFLAEGSFIKDPLSGRR